MSRILLVEDNSMNRLLVNDILTDRGHDVTEACDVDEAKERLATRAPELVLLDIDIPGGGGLVVLRFIREHTATEHVPVVAVTAFAMRDERQRFLSLGFDGYISKPIDVRTFGSTVEDFMDRNAR